jgi:hypothetical protein
VTQWYRRSYGQPVHERRVEEFGVHVALIHNLVIELTRAWIWSSIGRIRRTRTRSVAPAMLWRRQVPTTR